ncbi:MAG: type II toxin-antitoxin system VapC family toxin [Actinobacteria bacterium]|nr:type II toxin-antitoxin system VapC family toxin [Actinomycetota bacterium]
MILDGSALVAVLIQEPGYEALELKMREADLLATGAPTLVEADLVLARRTRDDMGRIALSRFRRDLGVVVIPFGERHREAAADAFSRFGRGRHPASLNYGDCMSYATARVADEALLFVGDDFAQTDIEAA